MVVRNAVDRKSRRDAELKRGQMELRRRNEYLWALQETTLDLVSQLDLDRLLENIVKRAGQLMGTSTGYLYLIDEPEAGYRAPKVATGIFAQKSWLCSVQRGEGLTGKVWESGQPKVIEDYDTWPGRTKGHSYGIIQSVAAVPLLSGTRTLGVLGLAYERGTGQVFDSEAVDQLSQFARLAAVAIVNAQSYTTSQKEIAERQQVEAELRFRNLLLTTQQETAIDGILVVGPSGEILSFNRRFAEMCKVPAGMLASRFDKQSLKIALEEAPHFRECVETISFLFVNKTDSSRDELILTDGTAFDRYSAPMIGEDGEYYGRVWYFRDITERITSELSLRTSEERYHSLFENMLDGFAHCKMLFDDQGRPEDFVYLDVNSAFIKLTGLENVIGKRVSEVIPGIKESDPELFEIYGRVAMTGHPEKFEIEVKSLRTWFSISVYCPAKGHFAAVFDNVTERRMTEAKLREGEERYRAITEAAFEGFVITDERIILEVSHSLARMLGYEPSEMTGQDVMDLVAREDLLRAEASGGIAGERRAEYMLMKKNGVRIPVETFGKPILHAGRPARIAAIRDISERKRFEEIIRARSRLEATALLAAGIAHEINNPLAGIRNAFILLREMVPANHPYHEIARLTEEEIIRVSEIVKQMYELHRPESHVAATFDAGVCVRAVLRLLDSQCRQHGVSVTVSAPADNLAVTLPVAEAQQIVYNILLNAIQASPEGGVIECSMEPTANAVQIRITDHGPGIPLQVLPRIFEAFFTTRSDPDRQETGMGLGLSICQSLIAEVGGSIRVKTEVGKGTTFTIELPRIVVNNPTISEERQVHS